MVIAIIAVLFGIVYASLGSTREKARQSMCISNLKQLGMAFHMYLQDYDAEDNPELMAKMPFNTDEALRPYGGDRAKFTCLDEHPQGSIFGHVNYLVGVVPDRPIKGPPSTEWLYQQCGSQMVVFSDENHNFPDPNLPPTPRYFWILGRYDGSVTTGYYNTWANLNWTNPCFDKGKSSGP